MDIQLISDVHLEMRGDAPLVIERHAPNIVVAGDVCSPFDDKYKPFVADLSEKFDRVFLLTGNHCYYASGPVVTVQTGIKWLRLIDDKVRAVCESMPKKNVHFLQNGCYDVEGTDLTIFGSTLWSDVTDSEEHNVRMMIADYRFIPGFDVNTGRYLHKLATASLLQALLEKPDRRFLVATHHMPRTELIAPKHRGSALSSAFASNVACAYHPRIVKWVYGHTHTAHDDDRFHCNPVGYPGENQGVRLDHVISIPGTA